MATAASFATPFITGGVTQTKNKSLTLSGYQSQLAVRQNPKLSKCCRNLSVRAEYSDGPGGGGGDFVAGFLLGGAIFGSLAYVFAPQIRRSLLNEDEYGFQKARRPIYEDGGLEKTRQTLNAKISQLNNAIDNVASRLRGGNKIEIPAEAVEADSEMEAAM
ncbi:hypothetical protein Cni_G07049 [Canna indica]|uniref:Low-density receptor-like protein n=1 Tax=Canna indica TaxID=4628 RepID=A0AAQ3JZN1_9LILI|nr:hypothetical protein Cni_G07049 [Canna indica]